MALTIPSRDGLGGSRLDLPQLGSVPQEFREVVVAVARTGSAPLKQIAKDFGISEGCPWN